MWIYICIELLFHIHSCICNDLVAGEFKWVKRKVVRCHGFACSAEVRERKSEKARGSIKCIGAFGEVTQPKRRTVQPRKTTLSLSLPWLLSIIPTHYNLDISRISLLIIVDEAKVIRQYSGRRLIHNKFLIHFTCYLFVSWNSIMDLRPSRCFRTRP